jgi:hypothetical protein
MTDPVLVQMAGEVKTALQRRGVDATDPPTHSQPPGVAVFSEYLRRGGNQFTDGDTLARALVEEVVRQAKTEMRDRVRNHNQRK